MKAGNDESHVKQAYLIALHRGNPQNSFSTFKPTKQFQKYVIQIGHICHIFQKKYPDLYNHCKKKLNPEGSFMSLVLQQHENRILTQEIIPFLEEHNYRIASLMFDGCLVYKNKSGGVHINNILRSEERRVGKECRSRWSPYH